MKKSVKLKRKTIKLIVKNLIVLVALALVAFAGVLSWFKDDPEADSGGLQVVAKVEDGLEFYVMPPSDSDQYTDINNRLASNAAWNALNPNETPKRTSWHKGDGEVVFDFDDQEFKFMEGLFLCEVTSDGKTFQIPKLMQYDEIAYVDATQDFDAASPNDEYMSFDLYFRSESANDIKLVYDSAITPKEYYTNGPFQHPDDDYKDAAIGAVRMSLLNGSTRELLWIPGASVYYNGLPGSSNVSGADTLYTGLTSREYANKGAAYYTAGTGIALRPGEGTDTHAYYESKSSRIALTSRTANLEGTLVASGANGRLGSSPTDDQTVLTLSQHSGNYYYGHIRVNLWVEGEDAEARLDYVGGKFNMALHFAMKQN